MYISKKIKKVVKRRDLDLPVHGSSEVHQHHHHSAPSSSYRPTHHDNSPTSHNKPITQKPAVTGQSSSNIMSLLQSVLALAVYRL